MKILVTGGSGFIASWFYQPLSAAGHQLVNYDLVDPSPQAAGYPFIRADVRDSRSMQRAVGDCDAVLHLAAAHHDFGIEESTFYSVNEQAAQIMCDAMDAAGKKLVCFYSTVAVYGEDPPPLHEGIAQPNPVSFYGKSKLAGERGFQRWVARGEGRRCLVIRPTVTFGPRNFANMYTLIRQIDSGKFLPVGPMRNIKSLSYIENIVAATIDLWLVHPEKAQPFDVFNYIDKPDLTSGQITAIVYRALGKRRPPLRFPYPLAYLLALPFDLVIAVTGRNLPISTSRVRKLAKAHTQFEADKVHQTGFKAPVSLEEGIRRMVKWYQREGCRQQAVWHLPPADPVMVDQA